MIRALIALFVVTVLVSPAGARPWNVVDLGRVAKDEFCMEAAMRTFRSILAEFGAKQVHASDWVTFADRVSGKHDALISCNYAGNRGARATLVVHSAERAVDVHFVTRRISDLFEGYAAQITQAWRDSYN